MVIKMPTTFLTKTFLCRIRLILYSVEYLTVFGKSNASAQYTLVFLLRRVILVLFRDIIFEGSTLIGRQKAHAFDVVGFNRRLFRINISSSNKTIHNSFRCLSLLRRKTNSVMVDGAALLS